MPRTSRVLNFALGAALLGVGAYAWQLRQELAAADQRQRQWASEIDALKSSVAERDRQLVEARAVVTSSAGSVPADKRAVPPEPAFRSSVDAREMQLSQSPEMLRMIQLQRRAALDGQFGRLFRKLNLPPAELERLKDLLLERRNATTDVYEAASAVDGTRATNPRQLERMIADLVAQVDQTIQGTFGEGVYQQYKQYEQTAGQRAVVGQLERRLSYTASPLTFDQGERLVDLLSAAPPAGISAPEGGFDPGLGSRGIFALTEQVVEQSRAFLSQPQVDAFREVQAQAELQRQLQARRRALTPASTNPASPKP